MFDAHAPSATLRRRQRVLAHALVTLAVTLAASACAVAMALGEALVPLAVTSADPAGSDRAAAGASAASLQPRLQRAQVERAEQRGQAAPAA